MPLKYVTQINAEALSESTSPEFSIKYIDIGSVDSTGRILQVDEFTFENSPSRARRRIKQGDTIVSTVRTYLKAIAYIDQDDSSMIASTGFAVLSAIQSILYPRYLYYWMRSDFVVDEICARSVGVSYPATNASEIGSILIPTLPLETQKAIAYFLDRKTAAIDILIAKKQRLIQLLEEKRTALINQAVTKGLNAIAPMKNSGIPWIGEIPEHWKIKKLKFLTSKIGSGVTPTGGAAVYQSQGVPFLRSQNIHSDGIRMNDIAFISEQIHNQMSSSKVYPNDVLLNITGASIGRCSIVPDSLSEANVNQHVCIIRSNQKILPEFLHNYLVSEKGQYQIFRSENGISREGLNFEQIKSFYIVKPSPFEEKEIALWLDCKTREIDNLISKTRISIEKLQEYRRSLITAAVTGKLDINQEKTP